MEKEQMRTQVRAMVDDLFSEKEESEVREKTVIALEKSANTISDLTSTLEDKVAEMAELETKVSESEESIQSLKKELEAAHEELETSKTSLKEKEGLIEDMNKAKAAEKRMSELESAGVARVEKSTQFEKVKEMSEEDFKSYKEELVSVREAVEKELISANKDLNDKKEKEEESKKEEALKKEEELKREEDAKIKEGKTDKIDKTEPANITPGQAAMAAMNMEYTPDSNLMSKYAKLGEALASEWKEKVKNND